MMRKYLRLVGAIAVVGTGWQVYRTIVAEPMATWKFVTLLVLQPITIALLAFWLVDMRRFIFGGIGFALVFVSKWIRRGGYLFDLVFEALFLALLLWMIRRVALERSDDEPQRRPPGGGRERAQGEQD
jgi:hypothetical protein